MPHAVPVFRSLQPFSILVHYQLLATEHPLNAAREYVRVAVALLHANV